MIADQVKATVIPREAESLNDASSCDIALLFHAVRKGQYVPQGQLARQLGRTGQPTVTLPSENMVTPCLMH